MQLKAYLLSDEEKARDYKMLNLIFDELLHNQEVGIKMQVIPYFFNNQMSELLRTLLDHESIEYKNEFYDVFYDKLLHKLVDYLATCPDPNASDEEKESINFAKNIVIEIITICAKFHGLRMRYFIIQNELLQKAFKAFDFKCRFLNISIVKLFRTIIGNKVLSN